MERFMNDYVIGFKITSPEGNDMYTFWGLRLGTEDHRLTTDDMDQQVGEFMLNYLEAGDQIERIGLWITPEFHEELKIFYQENCGWDEDVFGAIWRALKKKQKVVV